MTILGRATTRYVLYLAIVISNVVTVVIYRDMNIAGLFGKLHYTALERALNLLMSQKVTTVTTRFGGNANYASKDR